MNYSFHWVISKIPVRGKDFSYSIGMLGLVMLCCGIVSCAAIAEQEMNDDSPEEEEITATPDNMKGNIAYLALGDSYTIGESVDPSERWPVLLGDKLTGAGYAVDTVQIIATTGWTTGELKSGIAAAEVADKYDLVSLLIGVNNQYRGEGRGFTLEGYKVEFEELLQQAISFAGDNKERVFVVSIPDYGATPFGQSGNPEKIAEELDAYNSSAKTICEQYGVVFFDITPISREAAEDPELVASDQLHPSGKMYKRWVDEVIVPDFILPLE